MLQHYEISYLSHSMKWMSHRKKAEWIQLWSKRQPHKIWNFIFCTKDGVIFCLLDMNETLNSVFMAQMKPHHLIQFDSALILRPNKTENGYRKLMYQSPEIILFHNPLYYSLSFKLKIFILQILQLGGTSNRMRHEISLSKEVLRVLLHRALSAEEKSKNSSF